MNKLGRGRRWLPPSGLMLFILLAGTLLSKAEGFPLSLEASVAPASALTGQTVTYTITLRNTTTTDATGASLSHVLPAGFSYVAGSTQILSNDTLIARSNPTVMTNTLTWSSLTVPAGRERLALWDPHLCAGPLRAGLLEDAARPRPRGDGAGLLCQAALLRHHVVDHRPPILLGGFRQRLLRPRPDPRHPPARTAGRLGLEQARGHNARRL